MNFGKLVRRHEEFFIKDLASERLHHAPQANELVLGTFYAFEINEDDDAVDLIPAHEALKEYGIVPSTGSFYTKKPEDDKASDALEAEAYFGTCELTGMRGEIVPCLYLSTDNEIVEVNAGTWLVHSVLGMLAGVFRNCDL